jgi:hypothetical protein
MDPKIVYLEDEDDNNMKNIDTIDFNQLEEYILSLENDISILNHINKLLEEDNEKVVYYTELYNIFLHQNYDEITFKNNKYNIISILNDIEEYIICSSNKFEGYMNKSVTYLRIIQVLYNAHQIDIDKLTILYDNFSKLYNNMNIRRLYLLSCLILFLVIYAVYILYIIGGNNMFDSHNEL